MSYLSQEEKPTMISANLPNVIEWYDRFYAAATKSRAYSTFCERVFGRNFTQHGFADMAQIEKLLEVTALGPESLVLEVGSGNGGLAAYIHWRTSAHITGIDISAEAIRQAQTYTRSSPDHLSFQRADVANLAFPAESFDTILALDALYFSDLVSTIGTMKALLSRTGQMAIFFSQGATPTQPLATFRRESLSPDRTDLGLALDQHRLYYRTWDFSEADYQHAHLKKQVLEELKDDFMAENNQFLYDNRYGEALGVIAAIEAGVHARYLFHVLKS